MSFNQLSELVKVAALSSDPIYKVGPFDFHEQIRLEIEKILIKAVSSKTSHATIRIFQKNGTRDDHLKLLKHSGLHEDIPLEKQFDDIFGEDYCIAINYITNWSERLSKLFRKHFVAPWVEMTGPCLGGIDVYAFIGKYQATPFGVHSDDEDTFLVGLGPNTKYAYVESANSTPPDGLPQYGISSLTPGFKKYDLNAGDFIYIPKGLRHILATPKYSVTLGVAPYPFNREQFLKSAFDKLVRTFNQGKRISEYGSDMQAMEKIISVFSGIEAKNTGILTECIAAEYIARCSGEFLSGTPCFAVEAFSNDTLFKLNDGHKALICKVGDCSYVYINGREIFISDYVAANKIVDLVNGRASFNVDKILDNLGGSIDSSSVISFIEELLLAGAIDYV